MLHRSLWSSLIIVLLVSPGIAFAQIGGGFGGTGGVGGLGGVGGGGGGNNQNQNAAGIKIDPQGVLSLTTPNDGQGQLDKKRRDALAKKFLSHDLNQRSKLRLVSLVRLEKQLGEMLAKEQPVTEEMFYVAGLQRIEHVFVDPEEQDVIIAGPAEGFVPDAVGRMTGVESGRPTLRLDDLCVALRSVAKSKQIGCSIDPVPQRLAELQKFIRQGGPATEAEVEARFNQMDDILGLQNVRIDGVPEDSHFATMLVEADYRMKRIAIGLEHPAIKGLKSHLAMLGTNGNTMQRWWFVPFYESLSRSEDGLAFELVGQRAQLLTEEEFADAAGNRFSSPTTKKSIQAFAKQFTDNFPQLADKSPVFAELQNLIDWVVLAALFQREQIPERIGWKRELLLDEQRLPHPPFDVPKQVPSQVSYKRAANMVVGLVCGGVVVHPRQVVEQAVSNSRRSTALGELRTSVITAPRQESHQWWWDAERH